jgi:hypothetical protein
VLRPTKTVQGYHVQAEMDEPRNEVDSQRRGGLPCASLHHPLIYMSSLGTLFPRSLTSFTNANSFLTPQHLSKCV